MLIVGLSKRYLKSALLTERHDGFGTYMQFALEFCSMIKHQEGPRPGTGKRQQDGYRSLERHSEPRERCCFVNVPRSPRHFTYILSSIDRRIKSSGSSIVHEYWPEDRRQAQVSLFLSIVMSMDEIKDSVTFWRKTCSLLCCLSCKVAKTEEKAKGVVA
jgi:hypothetical protein